MIREIIFFVGLFRFLFNQTHYLPMLLSLELIILSLYFLVCWYASVNLLMGDRILLFLSIMICEGVFGLCLLINFSRGYGCDMNYFSFAN